MPRLPDSHNTLYAITDAENRQGDALVDAVNQILAGGCDLVQYRDKISEPERRLATAQALLRCCQDKGARLIVNDDVELALAVGAHGVHLGQSDGSVWQARQRLGDDAIIGVTCHASLELAEQAVRSGADYLAFGRFFPSQTKPRAPAADAELLAEARQLWPRHPLVAIGGITRDNAEQILERGADYVAICHDVFHSADPSVYASTFAPQLTPMLP